MFVLRPVATPDVPALEALASVTAPGVHTLARTRKTIERAVEHSKASFAAVPEKPGEEAYVFVLESRPAGEEQGTVLGTATIAATAGANGTFFAFRNDVLHQVSRDLGVSHSVNALTLSSDLTGCSQLSGFYLTDRRGAGNEAALLSRGRLLYAATDPQRFAEKFFSSMAGATDAAGRSPFWEALGRKFFNMDFLEAERMIEGARNRTLIVELMPHYPVYVPLLPSDAQAAMGQVHPEGKLAHALLSNEGFMSDVYVDIFDGGPILQAHRNALSAFTNSTRRRVRARHAGTSDRRALSRSCLVATARDEAFRAVVADCHAPDSSEDIMLDVDMMRALDVVVGDAVLCLGL